MFGLRARGCILGSLMVIAGATHASCDRLWAQAEIGYRGAGALLKADCGSLDLAVGVIQYENVALFTSYHARATGRSADPSIKVFSVMKMWNRPAGWGLVDVGLGIGYAEGEWFENCKEDTALFMTSYICDVGDVSSLGIPIHASAAIGRNLGIGFSGNLFIGADGTNAGSLGVTVPLGKFTH